MLQVYSPFILPMRVPTLGPFRRVGASLNQQNNRVPRCYGTSAPAVDTKTTDLRSWVLASGGWSHRALVLRPSPLGGVGLAASEPLEIGTTLVRLPPRLQLGADPPLGLLESCGDAVPKQLWAAKLGLRVMQESLLGDSSRFQTYIQALPRSFPGIPLFYNEADIRALQFPTLIHQVSKRRQWLREFASQTLPLAFPDHASLSVLPGMFAWAWAATSSRAFRARMDGPPVLLPLIDMANHSGGAANSSVKAMGEDDEGSVALVMTKDIAAGEEVTISYGCLGNDDLLLDYGFLIPNNSHDSIQLQLQPSLLKAAQERTSVNFVGDLSNLHAAALAALRALGLVRPSTLEWLPSSVSICHPYGREDGSPCQPRLLAALRALCASNEPQLLQGITLRALGTWGSILSREHEMNTLTLLEGLCEVVAGCLPTTLEEDQRQLASGNVPITLKLALQYRIEKKKLLRLVGQTCRATKQELSNNKIGLP